MDLGLMLPVVTQPPAYGAVAWEAEADGRDLAAVAQAAENAGYAYLCAPEHIALPESRQDTRGSVYWCPFSTLGLIAAVTSTIRLTTYVLVLGYHHPIEIAKRIGTLDRLSGGRAVLGVGIGSLEEEFALLGAPFQDRGARADDAMRALTAALGARVPRYDGEYVSFDGMIVDPGLRADTEIWVGGRSRASLRRAAEHAHVWSPFGLTLDEVTTLMAGTRARDALAARSRPLRIVYYHSFEQLDPLGDPDAARKLLDSVRAAGMHGLVPHFAHRSRAHYVEQVAALAELASS